MVAYFLPLLSGAHKVYSTPENSFWCCVGSGFESHAKYAESIYYHDGEGLFVNLFIPSVLDWKEKGMKVRQETRFPASETTVLTLSMAEPVRTTFRLRYPSWSKDVQVRVNGKRVKVRQQPGSYIAIEREWKDGDRIEATYPMHLTLESAPDNPHRAALLYGPVVLAGALGTEGMLPPAPDSDPLKYNDYYTYDYHIPEGLPTGLIWDAGHPENCVQRISEDGLRFRTADGVTVLPLYDVHRQRYVVYWDIKE